MPNGTAQFIFQVDIGLTNAREMGNINEASDQFLNTQLVAPIPHFMRFPKGIYAFQ